MFKFHLERKVVTFRIEMDNARFQRVIPYKLQRRISRLIKIDDVLKEDSTSTEQIEPFLKNVMLKYKNSHRFS